MIRDVLLPELVRRFSSRGLLTGNPPDPIAVIPAESTIDASRSTGSSHGNGA